MKAALCALLVVGWFMLSMLSAFAAEIGGHIAVNTLSDSSTAGDRQCGLREAINNANRKSDTTRGDCSAGTGKDTISLKLGGTITLRSTLPTITNRSSGWLTIDGSGQT